jgi:hypothetical protein
MTRSPALRVTREAPQLACQHQRLNSYQMIISARRPLREAAVVLVGQIMRYPVRIAPLAPAGHCAPADKSAGCAAYTCRSQCPTESAQSGELPTFANPLANG